MIERKPAEVFPLSVFIEDEMKARGWTEDDLYRAVAGDLAAFLAVSLLLAVPEVNLDEYTAKWLGLIFDTSPEYWLNLEKAWRNRH
jgi:hypothetical protein